MGKKKDKKYVKIEEKEDDYPYLTKIEVPSSNYGSN